MIFSLASDIGKVRKNNEDFIDSQIIYKDDDTKIGIFALADGMGGHNKGEVASAMAVNGIIAGGFLTQHLGHGIAYKLEQQKSNQGHDKHDQYCLEQTFYNKREHLSASFRESIGRKSHSRPKKRITSPRLYQAPSGRQHAEEHLYFSSKPS